MIEGSFSEVKDMKIAILGATSHIAKGLISNFLEQNDCCMHLYARSPGKILSFFEKRGQCLPKNICLFDNFSKISSHIYDVIFNCVGVGTLKHLKGDFFRYFTVCEQFDNLILDYLRNHCPVALYISFSSGVVYGRRFLNPANENTENRIVVNHITNEDYYSISRINSETKHRSFKDLKIVDLRLFSYFSRFIDLTEGYFITDVVDCTINHKVFETDNEDIIRDYVHPDDLFSLILKCINLNQVNMAFDVYSGGAIGKFKILEYFSKNYNLKYVIKDTLVKNSATGDKRIYVSENRNARAIGYIPKFSSIETVAIESMYFLN